MVEYSRKGVAVALGATISVPIFQSNNTLQLLQPPPVIYEASQTLSVEPHLGFQTIGSAETASLPPTPTPAELRHRIYSVHTSPSTSGDCNAMSVPSSGSTLATSIRTCRDPSTLREIISCDGVCDPQTQIAAIKQLVHVDGEASLPTIMAASVHPLLPETVQRAAALALLHFFHPGSTTREEVGCHLLTILLHDGLPWSVRQVGTALGTMGEVCRLGPDQVQRLLTLSNSPPPTSAGNLTEYAEVRATAVQLLGSVGMPIALPIVLNPEESLALRAEMAEVVAFLAEPTHTRDITDALLAESLASFQGVRQRSLTLSLCEALLQAAPDDFAAEIRKAYRLSRNEGVSAVLAPIYLRRSEGSFSEAFTTVLHHPVTDEAVKATEMWAARERLGPQELRMVHEYAMALLKNPRPPNTAVFLGHALRILADKDPVLALELARGVLHTPTPFRDISPMHRMPVDQALPIIATYGSTTEAANQASAIALASSTPHWVRAEALSYLRDYAPSNFDRVMNKLSATESNGKAIRLAERPEISPDPTHYNTATLIRTVEEAEYLSVSVAKALHTLRDRNEPVINYALESILRETADPALTMSIAVTLAARGRPIGIETLMDLMTNRELQTEILSRLSTIFTTEATAALFSILNGTDSAASIKTRDVLSMYFKAGIAQATIESFETASRDSSISPMLRHSMSAYATNLKAALLHGINHPYRFDPATLAAIIHGRENDTLRDVKPDREALIIFPTMDANGALTNISQQLRSLIDNGYRLRLFECETDAEMLTILVERAQAGKQADLLIIAGHGNREEIALGAADPAYGLATPDEQVFDVGDIQDFIDAGAGKVLQPEGQVVLVSCLSGNGGNTESNTANAVRRLFPHAARHGVFSSRYATMLEGFIFDKAGTVIDVWFSAEGYRASIARTSHQTA